MRKGFTLVELLIVIAILAIMAIIMIGIINPAALVGRGNDARRKKDLSRIKVAFEEYANDNNNCYPTQAMLDGLSCSSAGFATWGINSWPCDPVSKRKYDVTVGDNIDCPNWYRIYAKLENENDKDIVTGPNGNYPGLAGLPDDNNYEVTSGNVSAGTAELSEVCKPTIFQCYRYDPITGFGALDMAGRHIDAYTQTRLDCLVPCCYQGNLCQ